MYRLESRMTAIAKAAYGNQVTRKANTITTTIRATCTSTRLVLPASDTCSLVTWEIKKQPHRVFFLLFYHDASKTDWKSLSSPHLTEGPQELRVRHRDDGEGHGKAKEKVYDDVGHVPDVPAVPVGGAGGHDALQLITSPTEQRRGVPHERPHPGQHHSSHRVSEDSRDAV